MSLRARLLAAFAYTLLIVIIALEVPLAANLNERVEAEVEAESASQAQIVAASAAQRLNRPSLLAELAGNASEGLGGPTAIVDGRGRLIAAAGESAALGSTLAGPERPELLDALDGRVEQRRGPASEGSGNSLFTAVPVVEAGVTRGAFSVEQDVGPVDDAVRDDVAALIGIGALALALGLGVAWILAGSIARPLHALSSVTRRMAAGDLGARAEARGSSEQAELARAFNEMAERLESLIASQRSFVADASHQLRTPLTGLRLRLEAAGQARGTDAAGELAAAERETERLGELVGDLLDLAASEEPAEGGETDVASAVAAAAARWRDIAAEDGRTLEVSPAADAVVAAGERDIAQILDNLIENAVKYSPTGSPVTLAWRDRDGRVELSVASTGGPLDEEELARAFERFYRGRSAGRRPGTGLGLAIVGALARRAGGSARIGNLPDGRVAAEVTLPVAASEAGFADS